MKHTECEDCKLRNGDCGHHFKMNGKTNYDIPSLSACDRYDDCMFFQQKEIPKQIIEDCKRVEIEDDGNRAYKTINIIRNDGTFVKIDISYARLKGSWNVIQGNLVVCPFCGATPHKEYKNFCPKCGVDMQKGGTE